MEEEEKKIKESLDDMVEHYSSYYEDIKNDLLYESGQQMSDDNTEESNNANVSGLMYLRKNVNRIVNAVKQSSYAVNITAKKDQDDYIVGQLNESLDEIIDSDISKDAFEAGYRTCVSSGLGYVTLINDYTSDTSLSQSVVVNKIMNPCTIMLDKLALREDGSDADYGCIINWIDENKAKALYGKEVAIGEWKKSMYAALVKPITNTIPELLYYYKDSRKVTRLFLEDGSAFIDLEESEYDEETLKLNGFTKSRDIIKTIVKCVKYVGSQKIDETEYDMKNIPIIRIPGDTTYTDEDMNNFPRGIIYLGKPSNDTANWYYKRELEAAKTAPLPPYIVDWGSIPDGPMKKMWDTFDRKAWTFLPYMSSNIEGSKQFNPPVRNDTTPKFESYITARTKCQEDIKQVIGLPDVNTGDDPANRSGISVFLNQRQGELATIHYQRNLEYAIKQATRVAIDMLGLIDEEVRNFEIEDEAGQTITIQKSYKDLGITSDMFEISLSQGPMHESKKQEGLAMLYEAANNPNLLPVLDLLVEESGVPNGSKIAERFKKMVPVELRDDQDAEIPAQAKAIMDEQAQQIQQLQMTHDQTVEIYNQARSYIQQLQMALQSKELDAQTKITVEQMKINADIAETQMKINADIEEAQIKAAADLGKEANKQENENIRQNKDIMAGLEKQNRELDSELTKIAMELTKPEGPSSVSVTNSTTNISGSPRPMKTFNDIEPLKDIESTEE